MKNTLILLTFICIIFLQSVWAVSPCKPGYVEPEDCSDHAMDPAEGNCYWAIDNGNCYFVYGTNDTECAENCYQCLKCFYDFGCCTMGHPTHYNQCFTYCTTNYAR